MPLYLKIIIPVALFICVFIYFFVAPMFKLAQEASEPLEGEYDAKEDIGHC